MKTLSGFKYLLFLFIFAVMGCEEVIQNPTNENETALDRTFKLGEESSFHINQLYTSNDGLYTIRINWFSDSRCPEGARCIWQGEITIRGDWTYNNDKNAFEVHSELKNLDKQPVGFTIQIIDAKPYPTLNGDINLKDVAVTLLIKKDSKLDTITFSHSMKGYELYSWASEKDWKYSILTGTNRAKTYDEVISNDIAVIGKDSLKMLLDKFPAREEIFWMGKGTGEWANLSYPDQNTVDEIMNYATQKGLKLYIAK